MRPVTNILLADLYASSKLEGCPLVTRNVAETIHLIAECDEGASFAQFINEADDEEKSESSAARRSIPSSIGLNLKKLTKGILDEENLNFKQLSYSRKTFKFSGSALNTIHFADGNVAVSDIKIKNLEFQQGEKEFSKVQLLMVGVIEINGDQVPIELEKKLGKSAFDVKITDVSSVTIEELASTFKASVENIELLKKKKIFKVDEIKSISFSNPTVIGKLTSEGVMQIVANADAVDENLAFGRENLFVVINKKRGENPKLALVFNIGKGKSMDDVFTSMTYGGKYKSSFPIVGKIGSLEWALSLSEGDDITLAAPEPMLLPIGLTARMEIPKADFKVICKDTSPGIPAFISIELQVKAEGKYLYKMTNGLDPKIENFLNCISSDKKTDVILPDEIFSSTSKINISHFYYDPKTSGYDLRMSVQKDYSFFAGALEFKEFDVRIVKGEKEWSVTSKSSINKKSGQDFDISLEVYQNNKVDKTIKATIQNLNLQEMLLTLGFSKDEFQLSNSFPELASFGSDEIVVTEEKSGYRISGVPFLFGSNLQLAGVAWKPETNVYVTKLLNKNKNREKEKEKEKSSLSNPIKAFLKESKEGLGNIRSQDDRELSDSKVFHDGKETSDIKLAQDFKKLPDTKATQNSKTLSDNKVDQEFQNDLFSFDLVGSSNLQKVNKAKETAVPLTNKTEDHLKSLKKTAKGKDDSDSHFFFRPSFLNLSDDHNTTDLSKGDELGDYDYIEDTSSGMSSTEDHSSKLKTKTNNTEDASVEKVNVGSITKEFEKQSALNMDKDQTDFADEVARFNSEDASSLTDTHSTNLEALNSDSSPLNVNEELNSIFSNLKKSHLRHIHDNVVHEKRSHASRINRTTVHKAHERGRRNAKDDTMVAPKEEKYSLVIGITAVNQRLSDVLENIYGKTTISASWLRNMAVVILLSNTDKDLPLQQKTMRKEKTDENKSHRRSVIATLMTTVEDNTKRQFISRNIQESENKTEKGEMNEFVPDNWDEEFTSTKLIFPPDDMANIKIRRGVSISCSMSIPENCKKNELCRWLKKRMTDDARIVLTGFLSQTKVNLAAKLHLLEYFAINDNVKIESSELIVDYDEVNTVRSGVRIIMDVTVKDPYPITIRGQLYELSSGKLQITSLPSSTATFSLNPAGYGLRYIAFADVLLRSSLEGDKDTLAFVAISTTIFLGKDKTNKKLDSVLQLKGTFYFDSRNPSNNYLIGEFNGFDFQKLADAFDYESAKAQKLVTGATFPNGARLTFTTNEEGFNLKTNGIHIDSGFNIISNVRVLEFFLPINCKLKDEKITCSIQMIPLDIMSGLVQVRYSKTSPNKGPVLNIIFSSLETNVSLSGYLHTVGTGSNVNMFFLSEHVVFNITGNFYDIFSMDLSFKAKFFGQILKTEFQFQGCLQQKDKTIIEGNILFSLNTFSDNAENTKTQSDALFKSIELAYKDAKKRVDTWKSNLQIYLFSLKERIEKMKDSKQELKKTCDSECGDVCVPFFGWNAQCYKIWGNWVGCPGWDNCKWKVKDILCIARCEVEKMGKKIVLWGDSIGIDAIIGLSEMATSLISMANNYLTNYVTLQESTKTLLQTVSATLKPMLEMRNTITYKNASIVMDKICTSGYLNKYWKASAFVTVQGTLFKTPVQWKDNLPIDLNIHRRISQKTINQRFPLLFVDDAITQDFSGSLNDMQQQQKELDLQKNIIQNKVDDVIAGRSYPRKDVEGKGTRTVVSTKEDTYYRSVIEEPIVYDHMNAESMFAYRSASPWNLLLNFNYQMNSVPLFSGNVEEREQLAEVRSLDSCQQMRRVVDKYDKLTQGMKQFAISSEYQRQMYLATKKSYLKDLTDIRKNINDIENTRNLSVADIEDLFFWYNKIRHGLQDWNTKSEAIYIEGQKKGLTAFKNQMDYILKKQKEASIEEYVSSLHSNGIDAYKRSHLPNFPAIKGGVYLGEIKKAILDLYNDGDTSPENFNEKIAKTEARIDQLKSYMNSCQQEQQ
ncbi:uncharacterized protein LOC130622346 isoform X2 [Hydractinia symbiolongicarpus]|uniref:uncharacterized protein LOC130622346 isoform X2 n=1 Tax=Hydractinia symbiolongicarpus TaxID=13093 RepID=UPI00254F4442|nr:uncharacterized protein LOC130622346 isoform X2 [Hydractinia symbiolongicarpus]